MKADHFPHLLVLAHKQPFRSKSGIVESLQYRVACYMVLYVGPCRSGDVDERVLDVEEPQRPWQPLIVREHDYLKLLCCVAQDPRETVDGIFIHRLHRVVDHGEAERGLTAHHRRQEKAERERLELSLTEDATLVSGHTVDGEVHGEALPVAAYRISVERRELQAVQCDGRPGPELLPHFPDAFREHLERATIASVDEHLSVNAGARAWSWLASPRSADAETLRVGCSVLEREDPQPVNHLSPFLSIWYGKTDM